MRMTVVLLIFAVALGGCAMNGRHVDRRWFDEAEIRAAERALEQALQALDPTTWVYSYTEDAVFVAPGAPAVQDRAALLQMAKAMKPLSSVSIQPIRTEGSANLATAYGNASWVSGKSHPTQAMSRRCD